MLRAIQVSFTFEDRTFELDENLTFFDLKKQICKETGIPVANLRHSTRYKNEMLIKEVYKQFLSDKKPIWMKIKPQQEYLIKFILPNRRVDVAMFEGTDIVDDLFEFARKFHPEIQKGLPQDFQIEHNNLVILQYNKQNLLRGQILQDVFRTADEIKIDVCINSDQRIVRFKIGDSAPKEFKFRKNDQLSKFIEEAKTAHPDFKNWENSKFQFGGLLIQDFNQTFEQFSSSILLDVMLVGAI